MEEYQGLKKKKGVEMEDWMNVYGLDFVDFRLYI